MSNFENLRDPQKSTIDIYDVGRLTVNLNKIWAQFQILQDLVLFIVLAVSQLSLLLSWWGHELAGLYIPINIFY